MGESMRRLRANRVMEGKPCAACGRTLAFGDEVAVCFACEAVSDVACWDGHGGCPTPRCVNAPLEKLAPPPLPPVPTSAPAPGKIACPHCGKPMPSRATICLKCKRAPTPDGEYHGPVTNAPGAVASMVWGIVGLFLCGLILGIIAIVKSGEAKKKIAADPRYGGQGYATAGFVLGIIDLAAWALILLVQLASRGGRY